MDSEQFASEIEQIWLFRLVRALRERRWARRLARVWAGLAVVAGVSFLLLIFLAPMNPGERFDFIVISTANLEGARQLWKWGAPT